MSTDVKTYYMNYRIDVPPRVAMAAYDSLAHAGAWRLELGRVRLMVGATLPVAIGCGYGPLRSAPGILAAGYRRHPVELELLPWSSRHTELGLRPISTFAARFPSRTVMRAGDQMLRHLDELFRTWADEPLRELMSDLAVTRPCVDGRSAI